MECIPAICSSDIGSDSRLRRPKKGPLRYAEEWQLLGGRPGVDQRGIHIFGKNMGKNMRKIIENPLKILKILKIVDITGFLGEPTRMATW